jgi:hypothetical protein
MTDPLVLRDTQRAKADTNGSADGLAELEGSKQVEKVEVLEKKYSDGQNGAPKRVSAPRDHWRRNRIYHRDSYPSRAERPP